MSDQKVYKRGCVKSVILLSFLFPFLCFGANAGEMVLPLGMKTGKCEPCLLKDLNDKEFSLKATLSGRPAKIEKIELNGKSFSEDTSSTVEIYPEDYLPFYMVEFNGLKDMEIYALQAQLAVANLYYHYFLKEKEEFYYLGRLPELKYDEGKNRFSSFEKFGDSPLVKYYQFLSGPKKFEEVNGGK